MPMGPVLDCQEKTKKEDESVGKSAAIRNVPTNGIIEVFRTLDKIIINIGLKALREFGYDARKLELYDYKRPPPRKKRQTEKKEYWHRHNEGTDELVYNDYSWISIHGRCAGLLVSGFVILYVHDCGVYFAPHRLLPMQYSL